MRAEHEPGADEHLSELIANAANRTNSQTRSANYTEIFNHIAQEINYVKNSLSKALSLTLNHYIFLILLIK